MDMAMTGFRFVVWSEAALSSLPSDTAGAFFFFLMFSLPNSVKPLSLH